MSDPIRLKRSLSSTTGPSADASAVSALNKSAQSAPLVTVVPQSTAPTLVESQSVGEERSPEPSIQPTLQRFPGHSFGNIAVTRATAANPPANPEERQASIPVYRVIQRSPQPASPKPTVFHNPHHFSFGNISVRAENRQAPPASFHMESPLQRKCAACEAEDDELMRKVDSAVIQRDEASNTSTGDEAGNIAQRIQSVSGSGSKLDEGIQQHLEQNLGADLSDVRIHTGSEADHLSKSVNAVAFTTGQDIFFRSGSYNPTSKEGQHLIAHEVVHTVQQASGAVAGTPTAGDVSISDPSDSFEQEADRVAEKIQSGHALSTQDSLVGKGSSVQRKVAQGQCAEDSLLIQRAIDSPTVDEGEEVRRRLNQRMNEALGDRTPNQNQPAVAEQPPTSAGQTSAPQGQAPTTPAAPADSETRGTAQPVDRAQVKAKAAELQPDARPPVDRAAAQQPQVEQAARATEESLNQAPQQKVEGAGQVAKAPGGEQKEGAAKAAAAAADRAASLANQAFSMADAQAMPDQPAEVVPPEPIAPMDAGGMPLPDNPEMDQQLLDLASQAQELREQGHNQRSHAAEGATNTQILQGNLQLVQQNVSQAESNVQTAQGHLEFRRGVLGQARQALSVSEQKAANLTQQAPSGVTESARGKERSAPLASESRNLVGRNNANTPDDPEASQKSREQGGKLNQVSSDAASIDDTLTQVNAASNTLVQDAAHATQVNTQTRGRVDAMDAALQQTDTSLSQMQAQSAEARNQMSAFQEQPALMQAEARGMEAEGQDMVAASQEIEERIHQAQQNHAAAMQAVPAVAPPDEPSSEVPGEEMASEEAIAELPEAELTSASAAESVAGAQEDSAAALDETESGETVLIQRQAALTAAPPDAEAPSQPSNINIARGLPSWLTGEAEPNAAERQAAQEREQARRQQEIDEINAIARERGGFERMSAAERRRTAFRLAMRNTFGGISNVSWPGLGGIARGAGHLAVGLIDPRAPLMGVVSGVNMIINGVVNFARQPSWIGALRLSANVATGLTIILGSITALAGVIAAIMTAISIISLGTAAPITGPIIAFCATIMTTVGGWTFWVGLIAAALQALTFVADLWQAGTAQTADQLQQQSETMTEDARNAGNALLQAGMGKLAQVGGRQMQSAIAEAGGGVRFAAQMGARGPVASAVSGVRRAGVMGYTKELAQGAGRRIASGYRYLSTTTVSEAASGARGALGRAWRGMTRSEAPTVTGRQGFSRDFLLGKDIPQGSYMSSSRAIVRGELEAVGVVRPRPPAGAGGEPTPVAEPVPSPRGTGEASEALPESAPAREAPTPQREGVADISDATPESAATREASVQGSGRVESDQLSSQQIRNEIDHVGSHPELIEGNPPNRTAKIGNHEWQEQPGGRWCRHSGREVCVLEFEQTRAEMRAADPDSPVRRLNEADEVYEQRLEGMLERNPPIRDELREQVEARLTRQRERRYSSEESLNMTGDETSPMRRPGERPHEYEARLRQLREELNPITDEEFAQALAREQDLQARLGRRERIRQTRRDLGDSAEHLGEPQTGRAKVDPDFDGPNGRIARAQERRSAISGPDAERELITDAITRSSGDETLADIWANSQQEAQNLFHTLDEMAERGEIAAKRIRLEQGQVGESLPIKDPQSPPFRRDPSTGTQGPGGRVDQPFRGPERHMEGSQGPSQIHYNADFYFQGRKVTIHIFFPQPV